MSAPCGWRDSAEVDRCRTWHPFLQPTNVSMAAAFESLPISLLEVILNHHTFARQTLERRQSGTKERLPSAADFYVDNLPGLPASSRIKLYSGHLPAYDPQQSQDGHPDPHLFFLLARAKHIADRPRTIFWFNGGPGCSSFDGALMEIGPLRVNATTTSKGRPTLQLIETQHSWAEYADVIFGIFSLQQASRINLTMPFSRSTSWNRIIVYKQRTRSRRACSSE